MMIEINLIQQKKKEPPIALFTVIILTIITVCSSIFLWLLMQNDIARIDSLEKRIEQTRELIASNKANQPFSSSSLESLHNAIDWTEQERIAIVPLLHHLSSLLPEKGFFQSFSYNGDNKVELNVQFTSSNEAAYYLHELISSQWFTDAKLISMIKNDNQPTLYYTAYYVLTINKEHVKADSENEGGSE
ncbi:PilN domain-containing protein [Bacillus sp. FJAT-49732]|uniref:PilN domain-containing protein n=1 Tax=Lederbergia citrisecunda TaxID=2833583 RepID=A0A942YKN8_9BACI|nr:PilN domain-containing protein [Lederbergia citrisecunda]MBS4199817.1 PilN domain-containing protein [Lederbergia citrisecunda]